MFDLVFAAARSAIICALVAAKQCQHARSPLQYRVRRTYVCRSFVKR